MPEILWKLDNLDKKRKWNIILRLIEITKFNY